MGDITTQTQQSDLYIWGVMFALLVVIAIFLAWKSKDIPR